MDACTSPASQQRCTRLLLVDTDGFLGDDVGGTLRAHEELVVVAVTRSIEDAYECAARAMPDVIVIGWGKGSRAFVHATLAGRSDGLPDPLVVIVLRRGITSVPGLTSLSLLPNVALLMQDQFDRLLHRRGPAKRAERAH
ncbi:MAG: hypothetical protein V5B60_12760 [Accumulibacter sp.]|uniref:hypothetical protein n=1 Tax=Accumulibacter sp. TaxID=2053492 RepID=UPI002FC306AD